MGFVESVHVPGEEARVLSSGEIRALFDACSANRSLAGSRDAGIRPGPQRAQLFQLIRSECLPSGRLAWIRRRIADDHRGAPSFSLRAR